MATELEKHLRERLPLLTGPWLKQNSSYEEGLCGVLGFTAAASRYWDATWGEHRIEIKKGTSRWLDAVRYSEIVLGTSEDTREEVLTLFFIPDKSKELITQIIGVETQSLVDHLRLTTAEAQQLVDLHKHFGRRLNAQVSVPKSALTSMALFDLP